MSAVENEDIEPGRADALAALRQANNNVQEATAILMQRVMSDRELFWSVMKPFVRLACSETLNNIVRHQRQSIWNKTVEPVPAPAAALRPVATAHTGPARVAALVRGTVRGLMDFPLPGGKRLGDSRRGEILEAAHSYKTQSDDMGAKARWLTLIAGRLDDDDLVRTALTEADLTKLRQEASHV